MTADRLRYASRVDRAGQVHVGLQHLQVLARQQHAGVGDVDRVTGELHAVFGSADGRGADAFPRGQQRVRQLARVHAPAHRGAQAPAEVTEIARLAAVDILGHAAREHHAREPFEGLERLGEPKRRHLCLRWILRERREERIGHPVRDTPDLIVGHGSADRPFDAGIPRELLAGGIQARDSSALVRHEAPADVDRRGVDHAPVLDQRQLGRAAADVDIEHRPLQIARGLRGARAVRGQQRLHVVAGRGADELAAHLRDHLGDRLGVLAPQRLAGEDDGAGVDVVGVDARLGVGAVDDLAHRPLVDSLLALVRRERNRRLVQRLALDHEIAAGEVLGHALHVDAREDQLRAGRADVDADRDELDVVLQPERVVLRAPLAHVVMVVVVVELPLGVGVHAALAHHVVLQRVLLRPERLSHGAIPRS